MKKEFNNTDKEASDKVDANSNNLSVTDLITDKAIEIVFENTRFVNITPRELIARDLDQVFRGLQVGHTMEYCLLQLGLIASSSYKNYVVTKIGRRYLECLER